MWRQTLGAIRVFYDLKLSKEPCNIAIPTEYTPAKVADTSEKSSESASGNTTEKKEKSKGSFLKNALKEWWGQ